jgi:hypothetical protein
VFFDHEKVSSTHHDLPSFHHVLTIKKPRSVHLFFENPLQKHPFTTPNKNRAVLSSQTVLNPLSKAKRKRKLFYI